jgi:tetratricopeptide (TPR) repeat protein
VRNLSIGLIAAWLAVHALAAAVNDHPGTPPAGKAGRPAKAAKPAKMPAPDPVEREYQKLLADDDAAQEEVDGWIKQDQVLRSRGETASQATLPGRIEQRLEPVRRAYDDFLQRHPKHVKARLAYGSFLNDTGREEEGIKQWEKARDIEPKNPAAWNNLANHYGHRGPVTNAFACYAKAIELDPTEAVYYQNLATTVFLFRTDAKEFYRIGEQQVFDKALELYHKALKLDPTNFVLAQDLAQTYYGIQPPRYADAIAAWEYTLQIAADSVQREGALLHLARMKGSAGRFAEARKDLESVTNADYADLRARVARSLDQKQKNAAATNALPAAATAR